MSMIEKIPRIYLDTNVCRDCVKGRNNDTIHTIGIIRDNKWLCFSSIFTLMELIDIEKESIYYYNKIRNGWDVNKIMRERREKDLDSGNLKEAAEGARSFFTSNNFITFVNLRKDTEWNLAREISSTSNLSAEDVIQLVTAWQSKCDILITSDKFLIEEGTKILSIMKASNKMKICKPSELKEALTQLGFEKKTELYKSSDLNEQIKATTIPEFESTIDRIEHKGYEALKALNANGGYYASSNKWFGALGMRTGESTMAIEQFLQERGYIVITKSSRLKKIIELTKEGKSAIEMNTMTLA